MLDLQDNRWKTLQAGYRRPTDVRPLLMQLEFGDDVDAAWSELWAELHHQGDVDEASYAAVPHLVRIHAKQRRLDYNVYALVSTIELARDRARNPPVPIWTENSYRRAIEELARIGLEQLPDAHKAELTLSILACVALWKGARTAGRAMLEFDDNELDQILSDYCD